MYIYTLTRKHNHTDDSYAYVPEHVITLREEEPQQFNKFGAVLESDGKDTLWISSGWANEERGAIWRYNVHDGLSPLKAQFQSVLPLDDENQRIFKIPKRHNETATIFMEGNEHKVTSFRKKLS